MEYHGSVGIRPPPAPGRRRRIAGAARRARRKPEPQTDDGANGALATAKAPFALAGRPSYFLAIASRSFHSSSQTLSPRFEKRVAVLPSLGSWLEMKLAPGSLPVK